MEKSVEYSDQPVEPIKWTIVQYTEVVASAEFFEERFIVSGIDRGAISGVATKIHGYL